MAKKNEKINYNETNIKEGIILIIVILAIVLIIYLLTLGAQKIGLFDEGYNKPELASAVISYDNILAGSIFNKPDKEYYVVIADMDSNKSIYLGALTSSYEKKENHLPIYSVDLNNHFNKNIIGEIANPTAQTVGDLSINEPTLILIKDGRNHQYIVGLENIKNELGL